MTGYDRRRGVTRESGLDATAAEYGFDDPREFLEALEGEFQLVQKWRAAGAPAGDMIGTEGAEAEWNRRENTLESTARMERWLERDEPPPVPAPEERAAASAAEDETRWIEELERAPAVPGEQLDDTFDFGAAAPPAAAPAPAPAPAAVAPGVQTPGSPPADSAPPRLTPEAMAEADAAANAKRRGKGSAAQNGPDFVDLEPGDGKTQIGNRLYANRTPMPCGELKDDSGQPLVAVVDSKTAAQHLAYLKKENGEDPKAHAFAAKNAKALLAKATDGFSHDDKKDSTLPKDATFVDRWYNVFSVFRFRDEPFVAMFTLRHYPNGKTPHTGAYAVEALEVYKGALSPEGSSARGVSTPPRPSPARTAPLTAERLAQEVVSSKRDAAGNPLDTHPRMLDGSPFDPSALAERLMRRALGEGASDKEPSNPPQANTAAAAEGAFALDGGTPAEIAAERQRAAQAAKRAELEAQAAAPGPDLGTVSVQEGLPGIGGDGTLFTPPPGGWASPSSGALADAAGAPEPMISLADRGALAAARETGPAAATRPSSGSVAADSGAAKREGPAARRKREDMALVREALDAYRRNLAGEGNLDELSDLARRLEARSLYGSAALLRRANGEAALRPGLSTEGGHALWPAQEPGVARVSLAQLVDIATKLGGGASPLVARRLRALRGRALGYYDPGVGRGMVALKASLAQLVDAEERARIRAEVLAGGGTEEDYRAAVRERVRANMLDDAPSAAQVLAHEIGHWIDDLPELGGALHGRGNVLGHIASLKHYLSKTLFLDPKAHGGFDWDGDAIPGMAPKERDAIVREALKGLKRADFASDEDFAAAKATARREALENAMIERGLAKYEDVRGELDDLIAWYRQSDHAPEYFQKPWEMFAEAFSAWLYYPRTTAAKAPTFCKLLEAWGPKKGEAWAAVREAQTRGSGFEAALGNVDGDYLKRFRDRMRATTTAYYSLAEYRLPDLRKMGEKWRDFYGDALAVFAGELRWVDWASRRLERRLTGSDANDGWGTPVGAAARERACGWRGGDDERLAGA